MAVLLNGSSLAVGSRERIAQQEVALPSALWILDWICTIASGKKSIPITIARTSAPVR
jgi:hypothetical protein